MNLYIMKIKTINVTKSKILVLKILNYFSIK